MAFMFDELGQMLKIYENVKNVSAVDGPERLKKLLTDTRVQLTEMVASEGISVNSASLKLGVPPSMAIRHLKLAGVEYVRRPRVLTPELQDRLKVMLITGKSRDEIASALGIRKAFIKDNLAGQPDLRTAWQEARFARQLKEYRSRFLATCRNNLGLSLKRLAAIPGNGIAWLKRNDSSWLVAHLPAIWNQPINRGLSDSPMPVEPRLESPSNAPSKRPGTNN